MRRTDAEDLGARRPSSYVAPSGGATRRRALVVDSSPAARAIVRAVLEATGDLVVVGEAADAGTALALADSLRPELVTMDLYLAQSDGIDALRELAARHPQLPILVVTNEICPPGSSLAERARACGATEIVPKPTSYDDVSASELLHLARSTTLGIRANGPAPTQPAPPLLELVERTRDAPHARVLAMAAGFGGAPVLARVLMELPATMGCPIAVAQRLTGSNAAWFARTLRAVSPRRVEIVSSKLHDAQPDVVYLADDGLTLRLARPGVLTAEQEVGPLIADVLFESAAAAYGRDAVGVLLRGYGSDGAAGLSAMRSRGAYTLAEASPASERVFEMTRVATSLGAVARVLSLDRLPDAVTACVTGADMRETWRPPTL